MCVQPNCPRSAAFQGPGFETPARLAKHARIHNHKPPLKFECDRCTSSFDLMAHWKIHVRESTLSGHYP